MSANKFLKIASCLLFLSLPAYAGYYSPFAPCTDGYCFTKVCKGNGCYNPKIHLHNLIDALEARGVEVIVRGDQLEIIIGVDRFFRPRSNMLIFQHRFITLDMIALLLRVHGFDRIVVKAHTDEVGSDRAKFGHSQQQGQTIAAYLWSQGIPIGSILVIGCGDTEPVSSNKTVDGSAANRRIEIFTSLP